MRIPREISSETAVQKQILAYLEVRRILVWRNNTRWVRIGGRLVQFGMTGASDIIGCLPDGRFLAIEVKRKGEKPTPEQLAFLSRVAQAGGVALVAYSLDDVIQGLTGPIP